jgi:tRNA threonylcarbamoyladenosine biosynthesis protein TsaB
VKLLAIETSTMLGGAAILSDDMLIAESRINVKVTHSERIMTEMNRMLESSGLEIGDIDVFAIAIGPGSFTGLRVGLSTIKGLVYATGKRLVAVPTLEALAWNLPFSRHPVCPLLDARRKEVYAGIFKWADNSFARIMEEQAVRLDDLLLKIKEPTIFTGEGSALYRDGIINAIGDRALFAQPQIMAPSPSSVAYLGMRKAQRGEFDNPVSLVPLYLRRSEAEIKFKVAR